MDPAHIRGNKAMAQDRWKREKSLFIVTCPDCGADVSTDCIKHKSGKLNYCPNCGVKMTKGDNDAEIH